MALPPEVKALTDKHGWKLGADPWFDLRVETIYKVLRTVAPDRDGQNAKAEAFVLACLLEETISPVITGEGETPWQ